MIRVPYPPKITVTRAGLRGYLAAFDSESETIVVANRLVDRVLKDDTEKQRPHQLLYAALFEEHGHYIDHILRNRYSSVGGDAAGDEGAVFAWRMDFFKVTKDPYLMYAIADGQTLALDFSAAHAGIQQYSNPDHQQDDDQWENLEFFGAGYGNRQNPRSHAHRSIERVLVDSGFGLDDDLPVIYFGNWLRDYSQVVDAKIVRPEPADLANAQAHYPQSPGEKKPELDSLRFSREALTQMVGFVAAADFSKEKNKQLPLDFKQRLLTENGDPMYGTQLLGCYRPEEHIDNPMPGPLADIAQWEDTSQTVNPMFAPPPTALQLDIDPKTGLKNYINTPTAGQAFPTAVQYMSSQLQAAMDKGHTSEGLIHFGQALHVLEDYFAHSNFVEVALIKHGYTKVYPWVEYEKGAKRIPITTGLFGSTDVLGSLAPKLLKLLQHSHIEDFKQAKPGERTLIDYIAVTTLGDLAKAQQADTTVKNPAWQGYKDPTKLLDNYNYYLSLRDQVAAGKADPKAEILLKGAHYSVEIVLLLSSAVSYNILEPISHGIDDYQTLTAKAPLDTNPSHSQLAKDHDHHHFHDLAAKLAQIAVRKVGNKMFKHMKKRDPSADPIAVAKSYIVHPLDTTDSEIDKEIVKWAKANPVQMLRGQSTNILGHAHKQTENFWQKHMRKKKEEKGPLIFSKPFRQLYQQGESNDKNP